MKLSLRNRIAFYYLVAAALLVAVIFITVFGVVHKTVYNHLNGDLTAEASEVFHSIVILDKQFIFANPNEWKEREHGQIEVNPTFVQVTDSLGTVLRKTPNLLESTLVFRPELADESFFNTRLSGSPIRQLQMIIRNQNGKPLGYLLVAMPLQESLLVMQNLKIVLCTAFPLVLVILFFVTRTIAGKSIAPIDEVIETANRIHHEHLGERIPIPPHQDEMHRLASTINNLLDRIQNAIQVEQRFTSDASHELRTPVAALKGTLEVLARKPRTVQYYREKAEYCLSEVNRMSRLIKQMLLLTRYDGSSNGFSLEEVPLIRQLELVLDAQHTEIAKKSMRVTITGDTGAVIATDPAMLEILLGNILSNAVKYSEPESPIHIAITTSGEQVTCSVQDQGIGMSSAQVEKMFDRFYRADDSRSNQTAGVGLGLSIVRRLADLLHIDIRVESRPGDGTRVILHFNNHAATHP